MKCVNKDVGNNIMEGDFMAEVGRVTEVVGDCVVVKLQRQDACGHCNACTAGVKKDEMVLEAKNECKAKKGDLVGISLEQSNFLLAVIIMYIIPLTSLLLGIGLGYILGNQIGTNVEVTALIVGFSLLFITYFTIRKNEKRFNTSRFRPIADEVIDEYALELDSIYKPTDSLM